MFRTITFLAAMTVTAGSVMATRADARVCDYRPSQVLRSGAATIAATGARETASGLVQGVFTLTNSVTGASLLGVNAGAGALGHVGGAASAIGNAAAGTLAAPGAAVAGAVAAVGLGAYEGLCFFRDERINDYDEVLEVMRAIAASANPEHFRVEEGEGAKGAFIVLADGHGGASVYAVRKLYVVNGMLMHREWGLNSAIGLVGFRNDAPPAE
jgi:hypothetical protein